MEILVNLIGDFNSFLLLIIFGVFDIIEEFLVIELVDYVRFSYYFFEQLFMVLDVNYVEDFKIVNWELFQ